jgi:hypothetical protein
MIHTIFHVVAKGIRVELKDVQESKREREYENRQSDQRIAAFSNPGSGRI